MIEILIYFLVYFDHTNVHMVWVSDNIILYLCVLHVPHHRWSTTMYFYQSYKYNSITTNNKVLQR